MLARVIKHYAPDVEVPLQRPLQCATPLLASHSDRLLRGHPETYWCLNSGRLFWRKADIPSLKSPRLKVE